MICKIHRGLPYFAWDSGGPENCPNLGDSREGSEYEEENSDNRSVCSGIGGMSGSGSVFSDQYEGRNYGE